MLRIRKPTEGWFRSSRFRKNATSDRFQTPIQQTIGRWVITIAFAILATVGSRANTLPYTAPPPQPTTNLTYSPTDSHYCEGGGTVPYIQLAPTNIIGFGDIFRVTVYSVRNFATPEGPTFSVREPDLEGTGTGGFISQQGDPLQDLIIMQLYPPETSQTYSQTWPLDQQWDVTYLTGLPEPVEFEDIYTKQYSLAQVPDQYANRWLIIRIREGDPYAEYPVAFLKNVPLEAWITESPSNVNVGDTFTVQLTATNIGTNTYTAVMPYPLKIEGTNKITALDGPSPANIAALYPDEGQTFTYHFQAVSNGPVRFTAQVEGTDLAGNPIYSNPQRVTVPIGGNGLLLIRSLADYSDFVDNGDMQVATTAGQPARFQVKVQNPTAETRSFVLKAGQNNLPGWTTAYLLSGVDVSADFTNGSGYSVGPLASGDSRTFDVQETPDAAAAQGYANREQTTLSLYGSANDAVAMDSVQATAVNTPFQLYASLEAPTNVAPGATFTLSMTVTNKSDTQTYQNVMPQDDSYYANVGPGPHLSVSGSGKLEYLSGPTAPQPVTLGPHEGHVFTYQYKATVPGAVTISGRAWAEPEDSSYGWYETPEADCRLSISGQGDLLIKQADEPDSDYRGGGELQAAPVGDQVLEQYVTNGSPADFQVRLDNTGATNSSFVLRLVQPGESNVTATCTAGGTDITGALRSASGYNTGTIPAGGSLTVDVELNPTVGATNIQGGVILTVYGDASGITPYDAVEAELQTADIIIVNSTGDQPAANPSDSPDVDLSKPGLQVTLRSAIQFANQRPGKDIIHFKIDSSGTPVIQPVSALPEITGPVVIDGYSQDPSSPTPPIVINGSARSDSGISGLVLSGGDSLIRGLVIQGFYNNPYYSQPLPNGIVLKNGGENRVEGCFLGTTADGMGGEDIGGYGILITNSPYNVISGCLLSGCWYGGVAVSGVASIGNQITDNRIGTDVTGTHSSNHFAQNTTTASDNLGNGMSDAVGVEDSVGAVLISGASETRVTANLIGGNNYAGVNIVGSGATGNIVQGNTFGYQLPAGNKTLRNVYFDVRVKGASSNLIGGSNPGEGNAMGGAIGESILLTGSGAGQNRVQGNEINGGEIGINLSDATDNDIGGDAQGEGNFIGNETIGIEVSGGKDNRIYGNLFGIAPDGVAAWPNRWGIAVLSGGQAVIGGDGPEEGNYFEDDAVGSVLIDANSTGIPIIGNKFESDTVASTDIKLLSPSDNFDRFIDSNPQILSTPNDNGDPDQGGNHLQNYPVIDGAASVGGVTIIRGFLNTNQRLSSEPYRLDFYLAGQTVSVGSVNIGFDGYGVFTNTLPVFVPGGHYVCATATAPNGDTSEMSPVAIVEGPSQTDSDGISDGIEQGVPTRTLNTQNTSTPMSLSGVTSYNSAGQNGSSQITGAGSTLSPVFRAMTLTNDTVTLTWSAVDGQQYQLQYNSNLSTTNWINLGNALTATSTNLSVSDVIGTNQQRFYRVIPLNTSSTGDGNGDGIPDYLQNDVASFPMPNGDYVTLAAPGDVFTNVVPGTAPATTNAPAVDFPLGFVSFELTGVATGAVADVTYWLPSGVTVDSWWNYDPTNGWSDFTYNGTTGAEIGSDSIVLHYQDGGRGDLDSVANGVIEAYGGPGIAWGPVPMLQISPPTSDEQAMGAVAHLSWPATGVGAYLEGSPNLLPGSWHVVSDLPVFDNGNAEIGVTATNAAYFWRLHRSQ